MKKFYTLLASAVFFATTAVAQIAAPEGTWKVSRTGWEVTAMNETPLGREAAPSGPVAAAIDGDYTSFYHSNWADGSGAQAPQAIMVKLAEPISVAGIIYAPRTDAQGQPNGNGTLKGYDIYVGSEPFSFDNIPAEGTGAAQGELPLAGEQVIKFNSAVTGQYVLLVYRSGHQPQYFNCAELNVLTDQQPGAKQYNVSIIGATGGKVTVSNKQAGNGEQVSFVGELSPANVMVEPIEGYGSFVSIDAATSTVKVIYHIASLDKLSNNAAYYVGHVEPAGRGTWYVGEGATQLNTTKKAGVAVDMNDARQQFAILRSSAGNFYLYSIGEKKFIYDEGILTTLTPEPKGAAQMKPSGVEAAPWSIQVNNEMLNCANGYDVGVVTNWNTADNGNRYYLVQMGEVDLNEALKAIEEYESVALLDEYAELSVKGTALVELQGAITVDEAFKQAFTTALSIQPESNLDLQKAIDSMRDALSKVKPVIREGYYKLSNSTYGVNGAADETKVARFMAVDASNRGKTIAEAAGAQQIWKISAKENGKYSLQNAATGVYAKITSPLDATEVEHNASLTLTEDEQVLINFGGESGNTFLHSQFSGENLVGWTKSASASQWTLTPVEDITVVSNSVDGYFTFAAPFATSVPEGAKVYTATKGESNLVLTEVTGTIPANTGVLVKGAKESYTFALAEDVPAVAANELTAALTPFALGEGVSIFTLQKKEEAVAFYPYTGTTFVPYTAYMSAEAAGSVESWPLAGITGIGAAQQEKAAAIFDLSGRRVNEAKNGFFIINGQKNIVK